LAEIAKRLGRKALTDVAAAAKPDTLLRWYRELIAKKFDGSRFRKSVGRPPVDEEIEHLVVRMERENPSWGYDREDQCGRDYAASRPGVDGTDGTQRHNGGDRVSGLMQIPAA